MSRQAHAAQHFPHHPACDRVRDLSFVEIYGGPSRQYPNPYPINQFNTKFDILELDPPTHGPMVNNIHQPIGVFRLERERPEANNPTVLFQAKQLFIGAVRKYDVGDIFAGKFQRKMLKQTCREWLVNYTATLAMTVGYGCWGSLQCKHTSISLCEMLRSGFDKRGCDNFIKFVMNHQAIVYDTNTQNVTFSEIEIKNANVESFISSFQKKKELTIWSVEGIYEKFGKDHNNFHSNWVSGAKVEHLAAMIRISRKIKLNHFTKPGNWNITQEEELALSMVQPLYNTSHNDDAVFTWASQTGPVGGIGGNGGGGGGHPRGGGGGGGDPPRGGGQGPNGRQQPFRDFPCDANMRHPGRAIGRSSTIDLTRSSDESDNGRRSRSTYRPARSRSAQSSYATASYYSGPPSEISIHSDIMSHGSTTVSSGRSARSEPISSRYSSSHDSSRRRASNSRRSSRRGGHHRSSQASSRSSRRSEENPY